MTVTSNYELYTLNIALDVPLYQLFSYKYSEQLTIGRRVLVPFGNRTLIGFVWEAAYGTIEYSGELKSIIQVFPEQLTSEIYQLINFTADYYHHPIGQTVFNAIPTTWRKKPKSHARIVECSDNSVPEAVSRVELAHQIVEFPHNDKTAQIVLNSQQQHIVDSINLDTYFPSLLYGITGSGKTEVYLTLIEKVLFKKQQVLVLVPEINLTPQLLERFKLRFPLTNISILTSHTPSKQRHNGYCSASTGTVEIIIGTRLAVFTPFKNLGLIIVDEEHDHSFKQQDSLRYHARDLAIWRARHNQIPIILGSATPSLETLYNYKLGKFKVYKLTNRATNKAVLPALKLIDLNVYPTTDGLTEIVFKEIGKCLQQQELSLVFINRRGHSPLITCYQCGWVGKCNNCSANLVYHSKKHELRCHYCGVCSTLPKACPICCSQYLQGVGQGTQKVEQILTARFPQARIFRVDQDTLTSKSAWSKLYARIKRHEIDILVGTQILVKGHDFHNLTLVVGLNIDNALYSYDFRSSELLYAQLTQVAGRAGRGKKPGLVLLQTNYPKHDLYHYLMNNDFNGFVNFILKERKLLNLPPYSYYVMLKASGNNYQQVLEYLMEVKSSINNLLPDQVRVNQPVPAVLQRLQNRERAHMLISSNNRPHLHQFLTSLTRILSTQLKPKHGIIWQLDIDPFEF